MNSRIITNASIFILINILTVFYSFGQDKNIGLPEIRNYSKFDYNGGTQNWNIDQDKNGNLFFANNNGLFQFDGISWTKHLLPNSNSVRSFKIDDFGKIYIGSYNEFGFFESNKKGKYAYQSISNILSSKQKTEIEFVWKTHVFLDEVIFQSFQHLYIYKNKKLKIINAPNKFQFSFVVNNRLYIQDLKFGLLIYKNGKLNKLLNTEILNNTEIWGICSLNKDELLISTIDKGLFLYSQNKILLWNTEANSFIKKNNCLGGILFKQNYIILNSVLDGFIICDKSGKIISHINRKKGLQNNTVLTSFVDNKNNIWLGLDSGIAFVNQNSPFTFCGFNSNLSSVYSTIFEKNRLYVATNQGLFYHNFDITTENENFNLVPGTTGQAWNIQVIDNQLFCAHNRGAFLISESNQIQSLNSNKGYWNFKLMPNNPNFIIASNYTGFSIFEKSNNSWHFRNEITGFSNPPATFEIENDIVWLKKDQVIFKLKIDDSFTKFSSIEEYPNLFKSKSGNSSIQKISKKIYFQKNNVFYLYLDQNKNFLEDKKLSLLFVDKPKIKFLHEDILGNLWYAFNESLGVLNKRNNNYFDKTASFSILTGNLVNNNVSINTISKNNIFIGLTDGLAHFDSDFEQIKSKPKAFFNFFSIANDTLFLNNSNKNFGDLNIDYSKNNVSFSFASPTFENVKNITFSCQLEGFDKKWSEFSNNSFKEYTNLYEGDYKMKLKTKNSYGLESAEAKIAFYVKPPFYRSYLAYLVYLIALVALIYIIRLRIKAKIRKNKYYETIEQRKLYLEKESKIRQAQYELEKEIDKLKNEKLKTRILNKDKELVNNSLQVVKKNKVLNEIITKIKDIDAEKLDENTKSKFNKLNKSISKEVNLDKNWTELEKHLKNVHFDFLKRLKEKYPKISPRELDLSTYLLMNMSTKEIAEMMNISGPGVELARYRLRKKLNLNNKENLTSFMMSI